MLVLAVEVDLQDRLNRAEPFLKGRQILFCICTCGLQEDTVLAFNLIRVHIVHTLEQHQDGVMAVLKALVLLHCALQDHAAVDSTSQLFDQLGRLWLLQLIEAFSSLLVLLCTQISAKARNQVAI